MKPTWVVREGDCVEVMKSLPESSVDSVVCDPPYGLEFMGKEWDKLGGDTRQPGDPTLHPSGAGPFDRAKVRYSLSPSYGSDAQNSKLRMQEWHYAWAVEALRVLKPGGHLLAFGGTRTSHRMVCAIEDAGFEIRDSLIWMYGSGFPKSMDVSKAMDKAAGTTREVLGYEDPRSSIDGSERSSAAINHHWREAEGRDDFRDLSKRPITEPQTDLAKQWDGWGTALKPAHEPIVMARKPLVGTVVANATRYGTGALNIDATRIDANGRPLREIDPDPVANGAVYAGRREAGHGFDGGSKAIGTTNEGRWPANVILDEEAAQLLDEQSGSLTSGTGAVKRATGEGWKGNALGKESRAAGTPNLEYGDTGGASRFFYTAKASASERNAGLDSLPTVTRNRVNSGGIEHDPKWAPTKVKNNHPTVKPIALMSWLIRLVTPPGGTVLDPFTGSGSTGVAAFAGEWSFIGIEQDHGYVEIARQRLANVFPLFTAVAEDIQNQPESAQQLTLISG